MMKRKKTLFWILAILSIFIGVIGFIWNTSDELGIGAGAFLCLFGILSLPFWGIQIKNKKRRNRLVLLYLLSLTITVASIINWNDNAIIIFGGGVVYFILDLIVRALRAISKGIPKSTNSPKPQSPKSTNSSKPQSPTPQIINQSKKDKPEEKMAPKVELVYYCADCGYNTNSISILVNNKCPHGNRKGQNHILYEGGIKTEYTCKYCGITANTISNLTRNKCSRGSNKGMYHNPAL